MNISAQNNSQKFDTARTISAPRVSSASTSRAESLLRRLIGFVVGGRRLVAPRERFCECHDDLHKRR